MTFLWGYPEDVINTEMKKKWFLGEILVNLVMKIKVCHLC